MFLFLGNKNPRFHRGQRNMSLLEYDQNEITLMDPSSCFVSRNVVIIMIPGYYSGTKEPRVFFK